jgi:hypothetical protein
MSILRSGEIFSNRPEGGGGGLFLELREGVLVRWDEPVSSGGVRARPPRSAAGPDFLLEEAFELVIGMTKLLYCLLVVIMKRYPLFFAVPALLPACNHETSKSEASRLRIPLAVFPSLADIPQGSKRIIENLSPIHY